MKNLFKLPGTPDPVAVELQRAARADNLYTFRRGDHACEIEIEEERSDRGWLRLHGRAVRYHVLRKDRTLHVWINGKVYPIESADSAAPRATATHAGPAMDSLTAPMPGTILKIKVAPDDRFDAHQPLVIMESMKMEMTLSVPHPGTIRAVLCEPGKMVDMGTVLLTINPEQCNKG